MGHQDIASLFKIKDEITQNKAKTKRRCPGNMGGCKQGERENGMESTEHQ